MTRSQPLAPATDATGEAEGVEVPGVAREALSKRVPGSWTVTIPTVVEFINLNQRLHWAEKARLTRAWRNAAKLFATQADLPKDLQRVHITAHIIKSTTRQYDVHNLLPTLKAVVDGLVDYGLIHDDSNEYLVGPDLRQGGKGAPGIRIEIRELTQEDPS